MDQPPDNYNPDLERAQAAPQTIPLTTPEAAPEVTSKVTSEAYAPAAAAPGRVALENWQHTSPMPPSHAPAAPVPGAFPGAPAEGWPSYAPPPGYPPYQQPYPTNTPQQSYGQYPEPQSYQGYQDYQGYQSPSPYRPQPGYWVPTGGYPPQESLSDRWRRTFATWQRQGQSAFQAARTRPEWRIAAIALILLVMLVAGIGIGGALSHASATPTTPTTIGAAAAPITTVPPAAQDLQQSLITTVNAVQPSVVEVTSSSGRGEAIGSGEILTADGYIVTNDHVVDGFSSFSVRLSNGQTLSAHLVGQDAQDDLAVLKASLSSARPIAFADSNAVQVGQFAIALGSPLGLQDSVTFGIVSALNRTASEAPEGPAGTLTGLIQTSAPINPGNSGGALVDLQGRLIGIPTLGATDNQTGGAANGIGFAIPSNRVKYVSQQLISNGHLTTSGQGYLGIEGRDVSAQFGGGGQSGVRIVGFVNDASGKSPAQAAGLQVGDIITAVDGQPVAASDELASALMTKAPGTQVTIQYVRGSSQNSAHVTLGERPVQ